MTEEKKQKTAGRIPRKLKKQLKKQQELSKPIKIKKKLKMPKHKSDNVFKKKMPKLSSGLTRKPYYLLIQKSYNSDFVNYIDTEEMLYRLGKINELYVRKNNKIVYDHMALLKFVGIKTTEPELTEKILQLYKKRKSVNKNCRNYNNRFRLNSTSDRKNLIKHKKKRSYVKPIRYKWKRLNKHIQKPVNKTKLPIWISENIISQVEEKHFFISSAYRKISGGSEKLDFYTMGLSLQEARIITDSTRNKSRLIERYIIFYSFVGLYTDDYNLSSKIYAFEKHQIKLQEKLVKENAIKTNYDIDTEISSILEYFKRSPETISKEVVLEFLRIIKSWINNIVKKDDKSAFIKKLDEIIDNINVLFQQSKMKKTEPKNYGKVIHLTKQLSRIPKPVLQRTM